MIIRTAINKEQSRVYNENRRNSTGAVSGEVRTYSGLNTKSGRAAAPKHIRDCYENSLKKSLLINPFA